MPTQNDSLNKRWIVDYLQATDNEILLDQNDYRFLNLSPDSCGYLPRPTKWVGRIAPRFWISRLAWCIGNLVWRCGGAAAFHWKQFLQYRAYASALPRGDATAASCRQFALAFSTRATEVINTHSVPDFSACWVTFPWASVNLPADARRVDAFSLLSAEDLRRAWRHAAASSRILSRRARTRKWGLLSYTAFRWFAVRAALDKLDGAFFMAEHYDRWAILADGLARQRIRQGCKAPLALIQHGRVEGMSGGAQQQTPQFHLTLRRRLKAVSALYVYDQPSEQIFRESILSAGCLARGVTVRHFRPQVTLQDHLALAQDSVGVLFVGHPACETLHARLFDALRQHYPLTAFYKPHPLMPMSAEMAERGWIVITEKNYFPRVSFLISYPSTLVVEYAAAGIPAAVHPITLAAENCHEFEAEVIAHITPCLKNS